MFPRREGDFGFQKMRKTGRKRRIRRHTQAEIKKDERNEPIDAAMPTLIVETVAAGVWE